METEKKSSSFPVQVNEVVCQCGHRICDSAGIVRARCVKIVEQEALCRCKRWIKVPIS